MDRFDYNAISGADYIRAMFANTKPNGALYLEDDEETWYLDWKEEDAEAIAGEFECLRAALARLAPDYDRWLKSTEGMPEDLQEIWDTYLRPYPDHGLDSNRLFEIGMKQECDAPLTEVEKLLRDQQITWMMENALSRLPYDRCNPVNVIQHARRYARLIMLQAPKVVINNEAQLLAEELVWYRAALPFG